MTKINVADMHCIHCQQKIEKSLGKEDIECTIDLNNKTVEVEDCNVEAAKAIIKRLGFEVK